MFDDPIYENENYVVIPVADALGEDGQSRENGYAVVNKTTQIAEYTGPALPPALYNAKSFDAALSRFFAEEESPQQSLLN